MITHRRRVTIEISDSALELLIEHQQMQMALGMDQNKLPMLQLATRPMEALGAGSLASQLLALREREEEYR